MSAGRGTAGGPGGRSKAGGPGGRSKVVLLGMMSMKPVAGVMWQTLHYLAGLQRLGYEAWYVEAHRRTPASFVTDAADDGSAAGAAFIQSTLDRFGLGSQWAFHALHSDGRCYGLSSDQLRRLYRDAAVIVNLHGGTVPLPEHAATGRLVYLETDPVQLQVQLHERNDDTVRFLQAHQAYFSFGENYAGADCLVPRDERFEFRPTRQPVVLDWWRDAGAPATATFTTVGNWKQARTIHVEGRPYRWSKHHEFRKFLDLPARTGARFELALANCQDEEAGLLREHGWAVRDGFGLSGDLDRYRSYIRRSHAEFTVAKDQNVRLRSGWFSDRSATYLAAGRPVITQDTAFGNVLPTGEGLLSYRTLDEAVAAVDAVNADHHRHSRAARAVAGEYFDSDVILKALMAEVGA